ncbi:mechanosensitive ion channel family protein [Arenicella xantha]|uniref:Miniconductance mechanosensitive channel n=1 Tax=Arenicella xantha TaxID=644221 RepID=A0A395JM96_9GAMM|nr:mechanosensitive ion channel domain-containing protein [Arenicella xantha]RBP52761.1 miniconductance mechanosensitive channel [Arenicella xantha]
MHQFIQQWVTKIPGTAGYESLLTSSITMVVIAVLAVISFYLVKYILLRLITKLITKTKSNLDDILIKHQVFSRVAYLVPAFLVYKLTPVALSAYPALSQMIVTLAAIYMVWMVVMIVDALINSLLDIYYAVDISRQLPIQSFAQVAKLVTYLFAIIVVAALVIGESPLKLFAGLGAMTAVLMLVFKDPILGFVAGLQLSSNRMVGIGDWVDIPQHQASGDILEIGLTTVKVKNFDNTITTVPTQSLINDSFKNWRGMQESGGRRIKRSIFIDVNSIRFCDEEALNRYRKINYITEYIDKKLAEVQAYNEKSNITLDSSANGRRLTNIGTFRAYVLAYLKNHPDINQDLTVMARQLAPTEAGIPIEIYAFSSDKNWVNYEAIQADIFDHLLAVVGEFDLRVFQTPSGVDLRRLVSPSS